VTEVFRKVSKAAITSKTVTVSKEIKTIADIIHQHIKRSATFIISQAAS
jgi:hypothetical protein